MSELDTDYLSHHGILGMHWGIKRGHTSSTSNQHSSEDYLKSKKLKTKKIDQMSNAELKTLTERMQLEKQYKDLKKSDISKGQKFVEDVLANAAKQTAATFVSKYMSKGVDAIINKITS